MKEFTFQKPARAMWACCLLLLVPSGIDGLQQPKADRADSARETRVTGTLVAAGNQPQAGKRVLLINLRLVDLMGKEVVNLPPRGTVFIDADVSKPAATARTDDSGRFGFKAVKPGRYSVGVVSTSDGPFSRADVTLLQRPQEAFDTLVFDVAPAQEIDLGKVRPKKK